MVWITIPQGPQYQTFGWLAHDLEGKDRTLKKRGIMEGRPSCEGALERQAGTLLVLLSAFWLQGGEQALTWSFWSHTLKLIAIPYHWRLILGSYMWWARNLWDTFSFVIHSFIHFEQSLTKLAELGLELMVPLPQPPSDYRCAPAFSVYSNGDEQCSRGPGSECSPLAGANTLGFMTETVESSPFGS